MKYYAASKRSQMLGDRGEGAEAHSKCAAQTDDEGNNADGAFLRPHLVIFDCDGTLVDSEVIAVKVFPAFWANYGISVSEDEFKENFIGKGNEHPDNIEMFRHMPADAPEKGDQLWAEALKDHLQPVPGMIDLVSNLKSPVAVGSNSSLDHVVWALKKTGLHDLFDGRLHVAAQVKKPKPAPDLFLHIANRYGFEPQNCIVIEDSLSGIQAAQNAGIPVVGFSGASHFTPKLEERLKNAKPNWFCSSIQELKELLDQIESTFSDSTED